MNSNIKKQKAIALRLQGKSYGEILKALHISSKGLLSYWFRDLILSDVAKKRLESKKILARKRGLLQFNKERTQNIVLENTKITEASRKKVPLFKKVYLLLIGAALYWAEGTTRERTYGYQIVSFSNSDSTMVRLFMRYIREILKVPEEKIYAGIHLHPNIEKEKAQLFWSKITRIRKNHFYIFNHISKSSKGIRPLHFLPYGTLNIRINDRRLLCEIKGHIKGIIEYAH